MELKKRWNSNSKINLTAAMLELNRPRWRRRICAHRPVGSGAAWRRSPHQKFARRGKKGREGRKERKKEEKEKREEKRGKKGRGEQERKVYEAYGCKTPPNNCQKIIKDTKRGGWKKLKKKEERKKRPKKPEKTWWQRTDWDVRI